MTVIQRNVFYNNTYDSCIILPHQSDSDYNVLSCVNILNERDKHFLYEDQFAMCANHYCAIVFDITSLTHSMITCSGAILSFQETSYFNPINAFTPITSDLKEFPQNLLDIISNNFKYYYLKDSRTTFRNNVVKINCTNDYSTCLEFEDGRSFCMGNIKDIIILHPISSFVIGIAIAMAFTTLVYVALRPYIHYIKNVITISVYTIPLIGMFLIMNSVFAISISYYIIGNILVMTMLPLITTFVDSFFEIYIKDLKIIQI